MEYKPLGRTGIKVSNLCFGTMTLGKEADEATSIKMYQQCRDVGINFFDTANRYSMGTSEEILGKCIAHERDKIILSTKVGNPVGNDINDYGLSRKHILLNLENSLRRLGTDYIDLYFLHTYDPATSIEETLCTLSDLRQQGKILAVGASNWAAWQIALALGISERKQLARFECIQPMYNLVKRQAEVEIFPLAKQQGIGVMTYSPLGGGLLSGKYSGQNSAVIGRIQENPMYARRYGDPNYSSVTEKFVRYAEKKNISPSALAVAWVMGNPAVTAPIIGARNLTQLDQVLSSLKIKMTSEMLQEITDLSINPPIATDRSEERM